MLLKKDPIVWKKSLSNELGRLAQGVAGRVVYTDTIDFIPKSKVPINKKVTYANLVCDYRPLKDEPFRVRITVGGDKLDCYDDVGSPAASLLETKLLINSTISDAKHGARFMSADLKDHFLASPMEGNEYMRIHSKYFLRISEMNIKLMISLLMTDSYMYESRKACMG